MQIVVIQVEPEIVVEVAFEDIEVSELLLEVATGEITKAELVTVKEATVLTDKAVITDNLIDTKPVAKVEAEVEGKIIRIDPIPEPEPEKPANRIVLTQPIQDRNSIQQELGQFVDSIREKYCGDVIQIVDKVDAKTGEITYKPKDLTKCPQLSLAPILKAEAVEEPVIDEEPIDEKPVDDEIKPIEEPIEKEPLIEPEEVIRK